MFGFISTSTDRKSAEGFAMLSFNKIEEKTPVLYQIVWSDQFRHYVMDFGAYK